jgi:hypothetical protein
MSPRPEDDDDITVQYKQQPTANMENCKTHSLSGAKYRTVL